MKTDIEKILTVFRGIGEKDANLATQSMHPAKYRQHNPRAADGIQGMKAWVAQHLQENSSLSMIRAFQDGPYVFTQTKGAGVRPSVFFDIFRFEDGLIVEHWVFQEDAAPANPTEAKRLEDTEKNKAFVRNYYETVHIGGDHRKIPHYVSEDHIRHEPGVRDGLAAFLRDLSSFNQPGKPSRTIDEVKLILGEGDLVLVAAKGTVAADPCVYIDLYRVDGEKLVEHWGFMEKVPPPGDSQERQRSALTRL
jgi:predicted SnoaL-like aldol condensation-catalyzing enzyme